MYCRKCGSKIVDDSKFCGNCGEEVKNSEKLIPYEFRDGVKKRIAVYSKKGFWELIIPERKAENKILILHKVKLVSKKGKTFKRDYVYKFQVK